MRITLLLIVLMFSGCSFDPSGLGGSNIIDAGNDSDISANDIVDANNDIDINDITDVTDITDTEDSGFTCTSDDNHCEGYFHLMSCHNETEMQDITCEYGCDPVNLNCFQLTPSNGVDPTLVLQSGLGSLDSTGDVILNSDTGEIIIDNITYRNPQLGLDTDTGIDFNIITMADSQEAGLFVFFMLEFGAGSNIKVIGSRPLIILGDTIKVAGYINVSSDNSCSLGNQRCPGAGGGAGGKANNDGQGSGLGHRGKHDYTGDETGGGGAGYFTTGGNNSGSDGDGGSIYGSNVCEPLQGGSGGGGGGHNTPTSTDSDEGAGGGGGGAIQLTALRFLELGNSDLVSCGINANGRGGMGNSSGWHSGGGGGGSGGAILLESGNIRIHQGVILTANGGGGGAGRGRGDGSDGLFSQDPALGGSCSGCNIGGNGASFNSQAPGNGQNNESNDGTGGGGGSIGRLVIRRCLDLVSDGTYSPAPNVATCHY